MIYSSTCNFNVGLLILQQTLDAGRIGIAGQALGIAQVRTLNENRKNS